MSTGGSAPESNPALTTIFVDARAAKRRLRRARIAVSDGPDRGKDLVIERERVTVGRSVICDLVLADKAVSGTHFEIVANEKGFLLRDLDSTNGTYCGDLRVQEVWIKPGTVIRAGQSRIEFEPAQGTVDIDLSENDRFYELVGKSVRMREIFATLAKVAPTELTVLVRGETGTGKELVARAIHRASKRAAQPLVVQDCSAIPKELIESTLFGHERGAFTGATDRHRGSFEQADGGTIFLDEIGELDLALQPKLLRVLENREIKRVGGDRTIPVNVRVVAATNRDLRQMVNDGTFREDLFYRLSVVQIELPPVRERPEDVPLLVEHFLADVASRRWPGEGRTFAVSPEAMARLAAYRWPGNIRELKNTVERASSLADGPELGVRDLLPSSQKTPPAPLPGGNAERFVEEGMPFKEAKQRVLDAFEAAYLKALLDKNGGNVTRSANAAGLTRYHLRELAKRYGIRDTGE
jgi:transcriptional regulator with GAF, ATPase, and Fis domain